MTESSKSFGKKLRLNETTSWERGESSRSTTNENRSRSEVEDDVNFENARIIWQEIQMARCIEDNTTNSLLEPYRHLVVQLYSLRDEETPSSQQRPTDDNSYEESAILTAINEHGLQNLTTFEELPYVCHPLPAPPPPPPIELFVENESPVVESSPGKDSLPRSSTPPNIIAPLSPPQPQLFMNETDHLYFMEAAVAVAIQKKGLSPYTVSMSPTR